MLEGHLTQWAQQLPYLSPVVAFFTPVLGGDAAYLLLTFLSGQGFFPLWGIIVGSTLGMMTFDTFWFLVPRSRWAGRLKEKARVSERYRRIEDRIESLSHHNDILILFISKVLVGTRILTLAYLSVRKLSFGRFTLLNAIATLLWAVVMGYVGYYAGVGYYSLAGARHDIGTAVLMLVGLVGIFYAIMFGVRWLLLNE